MKPLTIFLLAIAVIAAPVAAGPINLGNAKLFLSADSSFVFQFPGSKSHTEGDPQVHFKKHYFYWPAKTVVYVIGKTRIIGYADSRNGYTEKLLIIRPGKPVEKVLFETEEDKHGKIIKKWITRKTLPVWARARSWGAPLLASVLLNRVISAPRIIWLGAKKGWEVRVNGKIKKMMLYRSYHTTSLRTSPVTR